MIVFAVREHTVEEVWQLVIDGLRPETVGLCQKYLSKSECLITVLRGSMRKNLFLLSAFRAYRGGETELR
jgi:hypothetical protein